MPKKHDVFLSYDRADGDSASVVSKALQAAGLRVFYDRLIPVGTRFHEVIADAIEDSKAVIVLWSRESVASHFVREEAIAGLDREVLIPVLLQDVDPPFGFRSIQCADLTDWTGDHGSAAFRKLLTAIQQTIGSAPGTTRVIGPAPGVPRRFSLRAEHDLEQELLRVSELTVEAEEQRSRVMLKPLLHDHFLLQRSSGVRQSKVEMLEAVAMAPPHLSRIDSGATARIFGTAGVVTSVLTVSDKGVPMGRFRTLKVFERSDGLWRCVYWQVDRECENVT